MTGRAQRHVRRLCLCLLVLLAALAWTAPRAQAALMQDIFLAGTNSQLGSIAFPSESGSSSSGVSFSFSGFDQDDITSIDWALDPISWDITTLDLQAVSGDIPCPGDVLPCSVASITLSPSSALRNFVACIPQEVDGRVIALCDTQGRVLDIEFRHQAQAPEPGSLVLFAMALGGLGVFLMRRRRA